MNLYLEDKKYRVFEIDKNAFSFCKSLESIKIPNNVEKIGKEAFSHCINVKFNLSNLKL